MKPYIIFLMLLAITTSCRKETLQIVNLNGGKIYVIGHEGSGLQTYTNDFPANSFSSVKRAVDGLGADGFEVDVQMSHDSVMFLYHDERLETLTNGSGRIWQLDASYIKSLKFNRSMNSNLFEDEGLATLDEVMEYFSTYSNKPVVFLDLKDINGTKGQKTSYENTLIRKLLNLIKKYQAEEWVIIESFSGELLYSMRFQKNDLQLMVDAYDFPPALEIAQKYDLDGIVIMNNKITAEQVSMAHQNNIKIVLFEVKALDGSMDGISKNPDAIQTDNIELLQECLK